MRVIYFSHTSTNRDLPELQRALQIVPPGNNRTFDLGNIFNVSVFGAEKYMARIISHIHIIRKSSATVCLTEFVS